MIARMLYLHPDKNKLHDKQSSQQVKEHTLEYEINSWSYILPDQMLQKKK